MVLVIASCSKQIGKVELKKSNTTTVPTPPPVVQNGVGSASGMKVTPGAGRLVGNDLASKAIILPNDRLMTGTNISGRFSINKNQVR